MNTIKNIDEMPLSEIVAEFNALTGKQIKKFENRKIAVVRLQKAREAAGVEVTATVNEQIVNQRSTAEIIESIAGLDDKIRVLSSIVESDSKNDSKIVKKSRKDMTIEEQIAATAATAAKRRASIAKSWTNGNVAARRATRNSVMAGIDPAKMAEYKSVPAAFVALDLPSSKMIKFRLAIKQASNKCGIFRWAGKDYYFSLIDKD